MSDKKDAKPFGFASGTLLEDIDCDFKELANCIYTTSTPPSKHGKFEEYIFKVAPVSGLYWVKALGKTISTDSTGFLLQQELDSMQARLNKVYGDSESISFSTHGTIWNEPQDFMMGLLSNEIFYAASWNAENCNLPGNLKSIYLGLSAIDRDSGYMVLEYSFTNEDDGEEEVQNSEDGVL